MAGSQLPRYPCLQPGVFLCTASAGSFCGQHRLAQFRLEAWSSAAAPPHLVQVHSVEVDAHDFVHHGLRGKASMLRSCKQSRCIPHASACAHHKQVQVLTTAVNLRK